VVDTVIYISGGKIEEILQLKTVVKTPSGMMSADLARPVIEVSSFLTKQLRYEIYTY
jgi:ATPase